jgi:F0F1-type ATP synthase delta subunit
MKYLIQDYAKALAAVVVEARSSDGAMIQRNFRSLLQKNSDEARGGKILEATARLLRAKQGGREVILESARKLSASHRQELEKFLRPDDQAVERVNPSLVAGVRITVDGEYEFDGSLRGKMDKIFGNI